MENRNSMIAAAIIMVVFGVTFYYLPAIMMAVGQVSTVAAALIVGLFLFGMFIIFWLRGRYQRRHGQD